MKKRKDPATVEHFFPPFEKGLSNEEVRIRNEQGLNNKVKDYTKKQYLQIIIKNIFTFYNILLFGIGIILLLAKEYGNCFFMVIVFANTMIGLVQDLRAKIKLDKLSIIDKGKVKVVRNAKIIKVSIEQIVLDDIIIISSGEQIPCDGYILSGEGDIDESILTGESLPLHKVAGGKTLSGSYVLSGNIYIKVTAVGNDNYSNKLQEKTRSYQAPKSQMFLQLNRLFKIISVVVMLLGIATILSKGLSDKAFSSLEDFYKNFAPIAGALISMIPSGMYLLISTTLTVGVINLTSKKVLVQDMYSIETLARVDTLCIDKTGTLTDGNMFVYDTILLKEEPYNKDKFDVIISSFLHAVQDNNFTAKGMLEKFGEKAVFPKISALSFDSHRKYSSAELEEVGTFTLGAYGFVPLEDDNKIKDLVNKYSEKGYRVLVVGHSNKPIKDQKSPEKMTPIALILMQDHIRKNAKEIISWFIKNNVNIKVISGDNPLTVKEIARHVGIENSDKVISLEGLTDDEVRKAALEYNIFGRVSPEQKEIIIQTLKNEKHIVGMFGDGVNDLLALKASNVGITVGAASKAAKDVANIILYSNDFASMPEVIAQGRRVINNLQRTCSLFLIKTVFAITINVFFLITSFALDMSYPFEPRHFYGWDVVCIGIAAFFLALEKNNDEIVKGSFLKNIFKAAFTNGVVISLLTMAVFLINHFAGVELDNTITVVIYFMCLASFVSLFEVSFPFDAYRLIVFIGAIIANTLMFGFTYLSPFNVLGVNKKMSWEIIIWQNLALISILIIVCLVVYVSPIIIDKYKKRKEIKND